MSKQQFHNHTNTYKTKFRKLKWIYGSRADFIKANYHGKNWDFNEGLKTKLF